MAMVGGGVVAVVAVCGCRHGCSLVVMQQRSSGGCTGSMTVVVEVMVVMVLVVLVVVAIRVVAVVVVEVAV